MWNTVLDEAQAEIKIAGRNTNNLRYVSDVTLMAESEEELKSLLMRVKEESEKTDLKLNIQKTKIMASCPITSWQIEGKGGSNDKFYFLGLQNDCGRWLCHEIKRRLLLGRKVMKNLSRSVMSNSCDPIDCSLPGSSVQGILQARIVEWVVISFSRGSSQPRNWTRVSSIAGRFFTNWATREALKC